jgi:hypothetical protein
MAAMKARRLAIAGVLAAATACGSGGTARQDIDVRFNLSSQCFSCASPDECWLDCPGEIAFFAVDQSNQVIGSHCEMLPGNVDEKLRSLPTYLQAVDLQLEPGARVRFETFVYFGFEGCHRAEVNLQSGLWEDIEVPGRVPLYAGVSPVYTVEEGLLVVNLPLECPGASTCTITNTEEIHAYVWDTDANDLMGTGDATSLDVHYAFLSWDDLIPGPPLDGFLVPSLDLTLDPEAAQATFTATSDDGLGVGQCVGTLVTRIGGQAASSTASCEGFQQPESRAVEALAYYVDKKRQDEILAELGLSELPEQGLLVGRIMRGEQPALDATVQPRSPTSSATIVYMEPDAGDVLKIRTTGSWFVVTAATLNPEDMLFPPDVSCCEPFVASSPSGSAETPGPVGLVRHVIMATEINVP